VRGLPIRDKAITYLLGGAMMGTGRRPTFERMLAEDATTPTRRVDLGQRKAESRPDMRRGWPLDLMAGLDQVERDEYAFDKGRGP
jgi:hypothetical protein